MWTWFASLEIDQLDFNNPIEHYWIQHQPQSENKEVNTSKIKGLIQHTDLYAYSFRVSVSWYCFISKNVVKLL